MYSFIFFLKLKLLLQLSKNLTFPGGFAPLTPYQARGSAPGPRWGLRPQTPAVLPSHHCCTTAKNPGYGPAQYSNSSPITVFSMKLWNFDN